MLVITTAATNEMARDVHAQKIITTGALGPLLGGGVGLGTPPLLLLLPWPCQTPVGAYIKPRWWLVVLLCGADRVRVLLEGSACVATMSNQHAFVLHSQMGAWMRVADNSFSRSAFHSQFHLPASVGPHPDEQQERLVAATRA
jgi:hypothetical protein